MDIDSLGQIIQYVLNLLPSNIATDVLIIIAFIVTLCTLILRFWKEPAQTSKWHGVWKVIHLLASFKLPGKPSGPSTAAPAKGSASDVQKQV